MIESYQDSIFYDAIGMMIWQKRHQIVEQLLSLNNVCTVMDFGCCQGSLIRRLSRGKTFTQLVGVDIDLNTLQKVTAFEVIPELIQNNIKFDRQKQLTVTLYQGNVKSRYKSLKQKRIEAITLIEVIEHLYETQLTELNESIFGYYRPNIVVITTPNKEFNVWFGDIDLLRHHDHKFQWTQQQFYSYCSAVRMNYGYDFQVFGVGQHKKQSIKYGYCSQGAIFKKVSQIPGIQTQTNMQAYKVREYKYPFWKNTFVSDIQNYIISNIRRTAYYQQNEQKYYSIIDLLNEEWQTRMAKYHMTVSALIEQLRKNQCLQINSQNQFRLAVYQQSDEPSDE